MTAEAIAAYEAALPTDPTIKRKKMFGSPAAFVNRQMFFGIFENTLVVRIGPKRVQMLAGHDGMRVFTLSPEKQWDDYLQMDLTVDPQAFTELAAEAFRWTRALPKKAHVPKEIKRARRRRGSRD